MLKGVAWPQLGVDILTADTKPDGPLDLDALFADNRTPLVRTLTRFGTDLREVHRSIDRAYFQRKTPGRNVQWVQWNGGEESW